MSRRVRRPSTLAFPPLPDLTAELFRRLESVPRGRVTTFGDLARALGDRHAAVWVATTLAGHDHTSRCACHRVVRVTGETGNGTFCGATQAELLSREGVEFVDSIPLPAGANPARPVVKLNRLVTVFEGTPPLAPLQRWLDHAAATAKDSELSKEPKTVAGIDVAYRSDSLAVGAGVMLDATNGNLLWEGTVECEAPFPYIPGYLAFRELPALTGVHRLITAELGSPDVVFIDGQGRLHPRRAGVATDFAAVTGASTIGVGKSLLCGRIASGDAVQRLAFRGCPWRPVFDGDELLAWALGNERQRKPIYVSVGGFITLDESVPLTERFLKDHRLPEPTHLADRLSKRAVRGGR